MIKEKAQAVKEHIIRNKVVYISGGVSFLAGVTTALIINRNQTRISVNNAEKVLFNWYNFNLGPGRPGTMLHHIETGDVYRSQRDAARSLGLNETTLSQYLNGTRDHVSGQHFARVNINSWQFL
jgi:hypothetical protein